MEVEEDDLPVKKTEKRRKNSVAKKTKKVTASGNKVTIEGFMNREGKKTDVWVWWREDWFDQNVVNVEYLLSEL